MEKLFIIASVIIISLLVVSCDDTSGRKGVYKGIWNCGYPTYFKPDKFPGEGWLTSIHDTTWLTQYRNVVLADTHKIIEQHLSRGENHFLYDPMYLGGLGAEVEVEFEGVPSKKIEGGTGPHGCCDRTFDVVKVNVIGLKF